MDTNFICKAASFECSTQQAGSQTHGGCLQNISLHAVAIIFHGPRLLFNSTDDELPGSLDDAIGGKIFKLIYFHFVEIYEMKTDFTSERRLCVRCQELSQFSQLLRLNGSVAIYPAGLSSFN